MKTLGEYGIHSGFGMVYIVVIPDGADDEIAARIKKLWDEIDSVECVTEEDCILDELNSLGALMTA